MEIITSPTTEDKAIVTAAKAPQVQHLPLAEFITLALAACGSESANTRRAYQRGWGDFLTYASDIWGLPRPLAAEEKVLRADGKMTRTQWVYSGDTRIFAEISPTLRDGFNQSMVDKGLTRNTRNQRKNAVNTLLAIAYRDGYLPDDQARRLDASPYKKRERSDEKPVGRRLSREEVRALRYAIETKARHETKALRDKALVDCMLYAGLRRDEAANLTTGSLRQDGGRWWLVLTGKGGKTRRVKCHDALYKSLAAWAAHAGLDLGQGNKPLFWNLTKAGRMTEYPLSASVIGRLVAEYGSLAALAPAAGENVLGAHDLRRTCARNAYDNGATIYQVQMMLGHSDPKTTTRYIGSLENDDSTAIDHVNYG